MGNIRTGIFLFLATVGVVAGAEIVPQAAQFWRLEDGRPVSPQPLPQVAKGEATSNPTPVDRESLRVTLGTLLDNPTSKVVGRVFVGTLVPAAISQVVADAAYFGESNAAEEERVPSSADKGVAKDSATDSFVSFFEALVRSANVSPAANRKRDDTAINLPEATLHQPYCVTLGGMHGLQLGRIVRGVTPKGLVFDRQTVTLCGNPNEAGIFRFELEITDVLGRTTPATYRLVVSDDVEEASEAPLQIVTNQLAVGQVGAEYVFQLRSRGGKSPIRWNVAGLPDGLEWDTRSGLLGGSPALDGEFSVAVTVMDSQQSTDSRTLPLVVRVTPIFITTRTLGDGIVGERYQARLGAQGGLPPYRWEIVSGTLPEGIEFNPITGALDGIPRDIHEGNIRFRAIDLLEKSDSADLPLDIRPSSLVITTVAVADGFQNQQYSFALAAQGGVPPYLWDVSSGRLPNGLSLSVDGVLKGAPQQFGEFPFVFAAEDSEGTVATKRFHIRIQGDTSAAVDDDASDEDPDGTKDTDTPPAGLPSGGGFESPVEPTGVTGLQAIASDNKVGLTWKNPRDSGFVQTILVRSAEHQPVTVEDGVVVYQGRDENFLDPLPKNGEEFFYTAFADLGAKGFGDVTEESQATGAPRTLSLLDKPDPFIDRVSTFSPLDPKCANCPQAQTIVLGPPSGGGEWEGSRDTVSLGAQVNGKSGVSAPFGGSITVEFVDNVVVDGPGGDFTIFENPFRIKDTDLYFVEPAVVEVSLDGEKFYRFPFDFVPHYDDKGVPNLFNPFSYASGFAGVHPVYSNGAAPSPLNAVLSGGDTFDLSDLPGKPLSWIRFIRITSTGDGWLVDQQGDVVRHSNADPTWGASGFGNSGFDLDAVVALH